MRKPNYLAIIPLFFSSLVTWFTGLLTNSPWLKMQPQNRRETISLLFHFMKFYFESLFPLALYRFHVSAALSDSLLPVWEGGQEMKGGDFFGAFPEGQWLLAVTTVLQGILCITGTSPPCTELFFHPSFPQKTLRVGLGWFCLQAGSTMVPCWHCHSMQGCSFYCHGPFLLQA